MNITITTDSNEYVIETGVAGPAGAGVPAGGTAGQFLQKIDDTDFNTQWSDSSAVVNWGAIGGTLSLQTDLQNALDAKADTSHTHVMADITDSTWISDYTVTQSDVTQYESALTITESQISDLDKYTQGQVDTLVAGVRDDAIAMAIALG